MRIYITHCSKKKKDSLKNTGEKVTPDNLYTAAPLRCFVRECRRSQVKWAILSDKYGIWFPDIKHEWYNKDPSRVTDAEFAILAEDFDFKLADYDEIWFYRNPGRFHRLYKKLLRTTRLKERITKFNHCKDII